MKTLYKSLSWKSKFCRRKKTHCSLKHHQGGKPPTKSSEYQDDNSIWYYTKSGASKSKSARCCIFCGKTFSAYYKLETHINSHTTERPYKCFHCEAAYRSAQMLHNHQLRLHFGEKYTYNMSNKQSRPHQNQHNNYQRKCHIKSGKEMQSSTMSTDKAAFLTAHVEKIRLRELRISLVDIMQQQNSFCKEEKKFAKSDGINKNTSRDVFINNSTTAIQTNILIGRPNYGNVHDGNSQIGDIKLHGSQSETSQKKNCTTLAQRMFNLSKLSSVAETNDDAYSCQFCLARFISKKTLTRHIRSSHRFRRLLAVPQIIN